MGIDWGHPRHYYVPGPPHPAPHASSHESNLTRTTYVEQCSARSSYVPPRWCRCTVMPSVAEWHRTPSCPSETQKPPQELVVELLVTYRALVLLTARPITGIGLDVHHCCCSGLPSSAPPQSSSRRLSESTCHRHCEKVWSLSWSHTKGDPR